jgi:hypothetical protein
MPHDIKPKKMLNFHENFQNWVGNEDKNVVIEFIEKKKHDTKMRLRLLWVFLDFE